MDLVAGATPRVADAGRGLVCRRNRLRPVGDGVAGVHRIPRRGCQGATAGEPQDRRDGGRCRVCLGGAATRRPRCERSTQGSRISRLMGTEPLAPARTNEATDRAELRALSLPGVLYRPAGMALVPGPCRARRLHDQLSPCAAHLPTRNSRGSAPPCLGRVSCPGPEWPRARPCARY